MVELGACLINIQKKHSTTLNPSDGSEMLQAQNSRE
jgi:hypothetical protein